ncbi:hypothetical protein [Streptomyces malaysiensis]|uniref:hypothetical protein n=1 Tax=Streptomyces malaysiensis TaxID=92644 RepID=UPI003692A428
MQFIATQSGGEVAIMDAREALVLEGVLSLYVLKYPDSNLAIRIPKAASAANEAREARMEDAGTSA